MNTYTIRTGGQIWRIKANNVQNAVVSAFKRKAPKTPGILTEIRSKEEPTFYVDTIKYLQRAGYLVEADKGN